MKRSVWIILLASMMLISSACASISESSAVVTFHSSVCIKPHKAYHYMTCAPITVTVDNSTLVIPQDFDTDLASIPRWLWSIIAPSRSEFIPASILHDYLYTCHNGFERQQVDRIFYNVLLANGVPKLRAYQMYVAVRLFGKSNFNEEGTCRERLREMTYRYGRCKDIDFNIS